MNTGSRPMRSPKTLSKSDNQDFLESSRRELLTSPSPLLVLDPDDDVVIDDSSSSASWKLNINEFRLSEHCFFSDHPFFSFRRICTPSMPGVYFIGEGDSWAHWGRP